MFLNCNKSAFLLGNGSSLNNLTKEIYNKIKYKNDIWVLNNFCINNTFISPAFYHVYLKDIDKDIFIRETINKKDLYKKTIFLTFDENTFNWIPNNFFKYKYDRLLDDREDFLSNTKGNFILINNKFEDFGIPLLLEIMSNFPYKTIYLLGVDLQEEKYSKNIEFIELFDKSLYEEERQLFNCSQISLLTNKIEFRKLEEICLFILWEKFAI